MAKFDWLNFDMRRFNHTLLQSQKGDGISRDSLPIQIISLLVPFDVRLTIRKLPTANR
jgi:hypothetical protein